jgi:hypothetical protein
MTTVKPAFSPPDAVLSASVPARNKPPCATIPEIASLSLTLSGEAGAAVLYGLFLAHLVTPLAMLGPFVAVLVGLVLLTQKSTSNSVMIIPPSNQQTTVDHVQSAPNQSAEQEFSGSIDELILCWRNWKPERIEAVCKKLQDQVAAGRFLERVKGIVCNEINENVAAMRIVYKSVDEKSKFEAGYKALRRKVRDMKTLSLTELSVLQQEIRVFETRLKQQSETEARPN